MKLKTGQTLSSVTDDASVLVIKAADRELSLTCGGVEMTNARSAGERVPMVGRAAEGTAIGKRYVDDDNTVELLCTKSGDGDLAIDGTPLAVKAAKQLPASD